MTLMDKSTNKLQLELHVPDFEPIKEYYQNIGFKIAWERTPEKFKGYLVLNLQGNIICFWSGNNEIFNQAYFKRFPKDTVRGYGVEIVVMVSNIKEYYEQVKDLANVVEPLIEQPWGLWDFRATDPAGYYLRFTSEHNILESKNAIE
jgi:hypothetical protein